MTFDQGIRDLITRLGAVIKERGIPAGGNTGDMLVKLSTAPYNVGWTVPGASGSSGISVPRVLVPGRWVNTHLTATSMVTQAATANRLYLVPFVTSRDRTIDAIGCNVSTAAANSNVRLGVYNADTANGMPTGLPLEDSGLISSATTGGKSYTVARTLASETQYWTAIVCTGTATFTAGAANEMWPVGGGASQSNSGSNHCYVTHTATNALPDLTGTAVTWATGNVPMCSMRMA